MTEYFLPRHVHFCFREGSLIFLDLHSDEYTLVNGYAAAAMQLLSSGNQKEKWKPEHSRALEELLSAGLLTTDRHAGKRIAPTRTELAMELLVDPEAVPEVHVTLAHIVNFIAASAKSAKRLRWNRLEETIRAVEQRKEISSYSECIGTERTRELIVIFRKMRSFFPHNYLCLYDSFALVEFLAQYQVFPTWVFGIRLEPWSAHCWVQDGRYILNEGAEEATYYTPVMAI